MKKENKKHLMIISCPDLQIITKFLYMEAELDLQSDRPTERPHSMPRPECGETD